MICYLFPEPTYFLFSPDVPALLYYAYIPITLITLFFGFYIYFNGKHLLLNRIFLAISILLASWTISTLILWTNIYSDFMLFVWSFAGLILSLLAVFCIYFIYVFLEKKDMPAWLKIILLGLLAPVLFLTPTSINLSGFNITNCDAFQFWGTAFKIYYTFLNVLAMLGILFMLVRKYRVASAELKKQILLVGTGIELFLLLFFSITSLTYYLTEIGMLLDSRLEMYGVIGIAVLIIYISILIVRFKAFNIKLIAAQALVWGLVVLIGSQFFFIKAPVNFVLNGVGFLVTIILGQYLVKSVKKEIEQKEIIEKIEKEIERAYAVEKRANEELKNLDVIKNQFLMQTQHDLRTPLSIVKGYCELLLSGNIGKQTKKTLEVVERIHIVAEDKIRDVNNFLDTTQFQLGKKVVSLKPGVELNIILDEVFNNLEPGAKTKGIYLKLEKSAENLLVNADREKLKSAIFNVIDNSIKYTPNGGVSVSLSHKNGNVKIVIEDTGIGITQERIKTLFETTFDRGEQAKKASASGRGIGLYLSSQIIKAHNGEISVESEGEGKGSTFCIELPINN